MDALKGIVVVAKGDVVQVVVVVLQACHQFGGHKEAFIKEVGVLSARNDDQIGCASVSIWVGVAAIITLAGRTLQGGEHVPFILATCCPSIVGGIGSVNIVLGLFGHQSIVGRSVQLVATAAVLVCGVVL